MNTATIELDGLAFNYRVPPARDLIILDQVVTRNCYRLPGDMLGWNVLDIGGHIGSVALMSVKRGAVVCSFEPTHESYQLFRKNIRLNDFQGMLQTYELGVGKPGIRNLFHYENNESEANSLFPHLYEHMTDKYESVDVVSLEEAIGLSEFSTVDFLKLDCEGAESEILPDILKQYHSKIKRMAIEFHLPLQTQSDFLSELSNLYTVEPLSHIEYFLTLKEN